MEEKNGTWDPEREREPAWVDLIDPDAPERRSWSTVELVGNKLHLTSLEGTYEKPYVYYAFAESPGYPSRTRC